MAGGGDARRVEAMAAPRADAPGAGAPGRRETPGPRTGLQSAAHWFASLPRSIAAAITISGFLILINLLSSPHRIWFHWPIAIILFFAIMRTVLRRRDDR
jgi:adenylate cyclase